MAKYGSAQVGPILVDGVSLLPAKPKDLSTEAEAQTEDTTGLGDAWPEHTPTGLQKAALSIGEGLYDDGATNTHEAFRAGNGTARVMVYGLQGDTIGQPFYGHAGAFALAYKVLAKLGDLTKASVTYLCTGQRDEGVILQNAATKTADWNTEGADSVDNAASSSAGGVGYLQVTAASGFTNSVIKIRHSADDVTYADLVTFADQVTVGAQRVAVAGTVNRHLAIDGNVTGSGSVTVWCGFARS
jgi:hypothetical protein